MKAQLRKSFDESGHSDYTQWLEDQLIELLGEIMANQKEVISCPLRFTGVRSVDIQRAFEKRGITTPTPF